MQNQAALSSRPPKGRKTVVGLGGILAILVIVAGGCSNGAEKEAAVQLKGMGVLLVADSQGRPTSAVLSGNLGRDIDLSQALPLVIKLKRLESLDLSSSPVNDAQLELVAKARSVKTLNLSKTSLHDGQLKYVTGLPKLTSLYIAETKVTSAGLDEVATISGLEMLDIRGATISGGFEPLSKLSSLITLVAGDLEISDADVEALTKIPNLRRLDITGAEISPGAVEMLRGKIPQIGR